VCARYGLDGMQRCALDELPYTFTGEYWQGNFRGPLSAAAEFVEA
jgi:hypothetical protein